MSTLLEKLIGSAALKDNPLKCLCIKLKPGSVTTDKIADKAVTPAKLSDSVKNLGNHVSDTTKHITAQERSTWNSKQDVLTFDNTPTANSDNPVKSKGIKGYIDAAIEALHSLFSTKKIVFHPYSSSEEGYIDTGYVEGYAKYSHGSGYKKGVRIKSYSDYDQGKSEISLTQDAGSSGTTSAKIDAGEVIINAGESASVFLTDADIDFDGNPATITSSNTLTVASVDGDLNLNGTNVKINGKDADRVVKKVNKMFDPSGVGSSGFNIEEEGIYFTTFYIDPLTGSALQYYRPYLLLVGTEMRTISGGRATFLDQTLIRLDGTIYKRSIQLPSSGDIDWSTAPNFTEV